MERYTLPSAVLPQKRRSVALGFFDGVHIGHRAVITAALRAGDGACAVYTFLPETMTTKPDLRLLCTPREQAQLLEHMGVDELIEQDLSAVRDYPPERFVDEVLVGTLHAGAVACGYNYHFGAGGAGNALLLRELCEARGIAVTVVPAVAVDGTPVSSTAVRRLLAQGDMAGARRMLGRDVCLSLPVEHGQRLGHRLGMPTINQILPPMLAHPRFGVYAAEAELDGIAYPGVTNIGLRPTVGADAPLAETWIQGYDGGELYGRTVALRPLRFLRPERTFSSLEELRAEVGRNAAETRAMFAPPEKPQIRAVLFDFDDTLHRRAPAFHRAVRQFIDRYWADRPDEDRQALTEEMIRVNGHGYHMAMPYRELIARFLPTRDGAPVCDPDRALAAFTASFAAACRLVPDAVPTLRALRGRGLAVGVITNGYSRNQNQKIDFTGLRPELDIVLVSGDEGIHKPDPRLFRLAAARLGLPCESCLYVGDHPVNDIAGARSAGMRAAWLDMGHPPDYPCYEQPVPDDVPHLHAVADLLTMPELNG